MAPPRNHLKIWIEGASLVIQFPGPQPHETRLPLDKFSRGTNVGFAVFLEILRLRGTDSGKLAQPSTPSQWELDRAIAAFNEPTKVAKPKIEASPETRAAIKATLRKAGAI